MQSKKRWTYLAGAFVLVGIIYGLIYIAIQPEEERTGTAVSAMGREHIAMGATHPPYNSNPPTSGWHYGQAADWGFYDRELPDEQVIHNLEHGGVWIAYKDIDESTQLKLQELARRYPGSVIVTHRPGNDAKIALASWGRLDKLDNFDEGRMVQFIRDNKNRSPERLAH
ncbi:MAG: hypothetical protein UX17_C0081G0006 [Parcubacteria group bacterium GW2011_GWC2_45_7]|nr:MAG: hypothetical protein UX17_C0081G0006 [Parcubacteria group bacterium GW2011_GWC2_45_7]KKU73381.1 MAG: hypothetical protein UX98_C0008G0047 [Parcubacteria group bacterium GW2011_GWA2_47_26]